MLEDIASAYNAKESNMGQRIVNDVIAINNMLLNELGPNGCNITVATSLIEKSNALLANANITIIHTDGKISEVYVNGIDIGRIVHLVNLLNGHIDDA